MTRERSPAHYHIAVFAEPYARYAARQDSIDAVAATVRARTEALARSAKAAAAAVAPAGDGTSPALLLGILALVALATPALFKASRRHTA